MRRAATTFYPWPYTEGPGDGRGDATSSPSCATGLYGKPIAKQNGAPLRLAAPWKYGFKSVKSIVSARVHRQAAGHRSGRRWQASEYGFWANVNPQVPHPRWSQATEKPLGSDERIPTLLYNGYGRVRGRAATPTAKRKSSSSTPACLCPPRRPAYNRLLAGGGHGRILVRLNRRSARLPTSPPCRAAAACRKRLRAGLSRQADQ